MVHKSGTVRGIFGVSFIYLSLIITPEYKIKITELIEPNVLDSRKTKLK